MNKRLFVTLVAVFIFCVSSTGFAGPFADVPADHWAYDAINRLAKDGIVQGYDNNTFGGDKAMTRYEMAIIVGKAMEKTDSANPDNKTLINKLSAEFAKELETLGVRVTNVEKKVDELNKLKITGDFYFRYLGEKDSVAGTDAHGDYIRSRVRLNLEKQVNDRITANVRFTSRNLFGSGNSERHGWQTDTYSNYQQLDQYNIKYVTNGFDYKVGRQDVWLGQGLLISTGSDAQWPNQFDGIIANGKVGEFDTNIIVGKTTKSPALAYYGDNRAEWLGFDLKTKPAEKLSVGAAFVHHSFERGNPNPLGLPNSWNNWAINASYQIASKLVLNAEYGQSSNDSNNQAYFIAANYTMGKKDGMVITYVDTERFSVDPYNSIYGSLIPLNYGAGINVDAAGNPISRDYKAWQLYYYHLLNKNTYIDLYVIDAKAPGYSGHDLEWFAGWNVNF